MVANSFSRQGRESGTADTCSLEECGERNSSLIRRVHATVQRKLGRGERERVVGGCSSFYVVCSTGDSSKRRKNWSGETGNEASLIVSIKHEDFPVHMLVAGCNAKCMVHCRQASIVAPPHNNIAIITSPLQSQC